MKSCRTIKRIFLGLRCLVYTLIAGMGLDLYNELAFQAAMYGTIPVMVVCQLILKAVMSLFICLIMVEVSRFLEFHALETFQCDEETKGWVFWK